jgi:cysteinyl-tRNA synthetase
MVEAATGVTRFARRQVHVGTVRLDGAKMAKATGNLLLVSDLLSRASGAAVRLMLLDRRWHQPWEYHPTALGDATRLLEELYAAGGTRGTAEAAEAAVRAALLDDLDVSTAVRIAIDAGGDAARLLVRTLALH